MPPLPSLARFLLAAACLGAICAVWPLSSRAESADLPACLGESVALVVDHQMPYAQVQVAGRSGYFVLDFAATISSITPSAFDGGVPAAMPGTRDRYESFEFFGPWGAVRLRAQSQVPTTSQVRQAGVIGTDFLALHIYTLDYRAGRLYRAARGRFCSDEELTASGFRAFSTQGYYTDSAQVLTCPMAGGPPNCVNVPTIPVRIGSVRALAQLDTGYDDGLRPYSLNVNVALFEALRSAGVAMKRRPDIALKLSTCVAGVSEPIEAWQLDAGTLFGLEDTRGALLTAPQGAVTLFVKHTPAAAALCGGIGTWPQPAAQLGASFVAQGALVVDPFQQKVWLRP